MRESTRDTLILRLIEARMPEVPYVMSRTEIQNLLQDAKDMVDEVFPETEEFTIDLGCNCGRN